MASTPDVQPVGIPTKGRIPSLDGLRAISIALVVFAHCTGTRFFPSFVFLRENLGNLGVRIFFVISGYLITSLLLNEMKATGRISLKWFYIRRALRIFPAAYIYIGTLCIFSAFGFATLTGKQIAHAFSYTVNYLEPRPWNIGHLWSLSVEEQFYMLWPAVLLWAGRRRAMIIAACMFVSAPVFRSLKYLLPTSPPQLWGMITFQANADALAAGCVLAGIQVWLASKPRYNAFLQSRLFFLMPAAIVAAFSLQKLTWVPFSHPIMNFSIAVCIDRYVRFHSDATGKWLNWGPIVYIGTLSYSLYLWQEPFLNRNIDIPMSWFPINLLLMIPPTLASFYLVEKPFLRLRKRIEKRFAPAGSD